MLRKISCLLPLCLLLALSSCGASPSAEQVLDQLEESIQQQDGALCFQLPAHSGDGWNILIYGRSESDGMGMSLHYLEEVAWQPGESCSFSPAQNCTELQMDVLYETDSDSAERQIDLLPYIQ